MGLDNGDIINIILAASTLALALFTIFLVLVTVLPFFVKERKEHYRILNGNIFLPLTDLIDHRETSRSLDLLKFDVSIPPFTTLYHTAELHMEKDHPGLSESIKLLANNKREHNSQVDRLYILIDNIIRNSFGQYNIVDYNVRDLFIDYWRMFLSNTKDEFYDSDKVKDGFKKYIHNIIQIKINPDNSLQIGSDKIIAYADNKGILKEIEKIFVNDVLENDKIIIIITNILNNKIKLTTDAETIRSMATDISHMIDSDYYKTKAKCCPTGWTLLRRYIT
jgi:hypothetical protein